MTIDDKCDILLWWRCYENDEDENDEDENDEDEDNEDDEDDDDEDDEDNNNNNKPNLFRHHRQKINIYKLYDHMYDARNAWNSCSWYCLMLIK